MLEYTFVVLDLGTGESYVLPHTKHGTKEVVWPDYHPRSSDRYAFQKLTKMDNPWSPIEVTPMGTERVLQLGGRYGKAENAEVTVQASVLILLSREKQTAG